MLTALILIPLIGMVGVSLAPEKNERRIRRTAVGTAVLTLLVALLAWSDFESGIWTMQLTEKIDLIAASGFRYHLGVDGISLSVVLSTALLTLLSTLALKEHIDTLKRMSASLLLLESTIMGIVLSLDLCFLFLFWTGLTLALYRITRNRRLLFTRLAGTALLMVGILAMYTHSQPRTFGLLDLAEGYGFVGKPIETFLWIVFFLVFLPLNAGLVPATARSTAPAVTVVVVPALLNLGVYGLLRFNFTLLTKATNATARAMALLGVGCIFYGAFRSIAKRESREVVSLLAVSQLGFILLGLASGTVSGMNGACLLMFHLAVSCALWFTIAPAVGALATMALPGLGGFLPMVLVLIGALTPEAIQPAGFLGALGWLAVSACLSVRVVKMRLVSQGPGWREWAGFLPLIALSLAMGLFPAPFIAIGGATMGKLVALLAYKI